jgi:hypothetical protein
LTGKCRRQAAAVVRFWGRSSSLACDRVTERLKSTYPLIVTQSVSVPEKTLEHWASQYIMYRYSAQASLWWPATGQDIDVDLLPTEPGKAVQLELKTATPSGTGLQCVYVDIGQLWEYSQKRLGQQPFYAFPWPDWAGRLDAVARAQRPRKEVTELGFRRSGSGWWFGDWMVVMTTQQVADVLGPELAEHPYRKRGVPKPLVKIDVGQHPKNPVWGGPETQVADPEVLRWSDFWSTLDQCGRDEWPQLIRLPRFIVNRMQVAVSGSSGLYPRRLVAEMLRSASALDEQWDSTPDLVTLEPTGDGNYQIARDLPDDRADSGPGNDTAAEPDDHRQVVFLCARTLLQ